MPGWLIYFFAAFFAEKAVWLGMVAIFVSAGNVMAHTFLFNIKAKTLYNAGLVTSWLLFVPAICFFFILVSRYHLATLIDYLIAIPLRIVVNMSIIKLINLLSEKNSPYIFPKRNLLRKVGGTEV